MHKIVFIAHPMSGDQSGNMRKVLRILRQTHTATLIPIFPSAATRQYLSGSEADQRLAETHIERYFSRRFVDELRLYGDRISEGMWREVRLARKYRVPIIAMTRETKEALEQGQP